MSDLSISNRNLAEILRSITMWMQSEGVYKVIFERRRGIWGWLMLRFLRGLTGNWWHICIKLNVGLKSSKCTKGRMCHLLCLYFKKYISGCFFCLEYSPWASSYFQEWQINISRVHTSDSNFSSLKRDLQYLNPFNFWISNWEGSCEGESTSEGRKGNKGEIFNVQWKE